MENSDDNDVEIKRVSRSSTSNTLRLIAVISVTGWLVLLIIAGCLKDDFLFVSLIVLLAVMFYGTAVVLLLWLYSFIKSIFWHTPADKMLLRWHLIDLLLVGVAFLIMHRPAFNCDADIMAEHYDSYGPEMKRIVVQTKSLLPDSAYLSVEFDSRYNPSEKNVLSVEQHKRLRQSLEDIDCIGISVDKDGKWGYTTIPFRRIGMGMYSFQLFDKPLTAEQRDSINNDCRFIVYNDTTVFEYGSGAFGDIKFVGKEEFLKKLNHSTASSR